MLEQIYENNIIEKITNSITYEEENSFYFVADRTIAFPGYGNPIDEELCKQLKVGVISLPNQGGIIVSGKGSISLGHFSKNTENKHNKELTDKLINWLKTFGLNIILEGNDILVDGKYKVASSGSRRFGDILFSTFHISYNVDLDLINKICTKPMHKIPKGLQEYGIAEDTLLNKVKQIVKEVLDE